MMKIIDGAVNNTFPGCDFVIQSDEIRPIRLLQITDMQFIDSMQRRTPDRLRHDEISAWLPENFDTMCGNQIKSLVAQTNPDMIFITGDMVYGSFDDNGSTFTYFCELMESFKIPWAPIFGNHDNESAMGVLWQCDKLEACPHCLFRRGSVSGNGNYSVGIAIADRLIRVMHMIDSNGCVSDDENVISEKNIFDDQIELVNTNSQLIKNKFDYPVPSFLAYHIPTVEFETAAREKGYITDNSLFFNIGVDVLQKDCDFGYCNEAIDGIPTKDNFQRMLKDANVDGVFVGHNHDINTCISHNGIRWVFGLKTGQYDYHSTGQLGGTLVTLSGSEFDVCHIPALTSLAPYPALAPMFKNFFVE